MSYFLFSAGIDIRLDVREIGIQSYPQRLTGYGFRAVSFPIDAMESSAGMKLLCFATDHSNLSSGMG